ncbi:hypothetical protein PoB_001319200, partial [Plakobranchus ocellatus]
SCFCPGTADVVVTGVRKVKPGRPVELSLTVGLNVTFMSGDLGPGVTWGKVLSKGNSMKKAVSSGNYKI